MEGRKKGLFKNIRELMQRNSSECGVWYEGIKPFAAGAQFEPSSEVLVFLSDLPERVRRVFVAPNTVFSFLRTTNNTALITANRSLTDRRSNSTGRGGGRNFAQSVEETTQHTLQMSAAHARCWSRHGSLTSAAPAPALR